MVWHWLTGMRFWIEVLERVSYAYDGTRDHMKIGAIFGPIGWLQSYFQVKTRKEFLFLVD